MKVLQINSDYGFGSTGKITSNLHHFLLKNNIESYVCYGRKNKNVEQNTFPVISPTVSKAEHIISNLLGDPYGLCFLSTQRAKKIIKKINPDIIHVQCINGYFVNVYNLLKWIAKKDFKVVVTLHAEFMYTGGCDHSYECTKWKKQCYKCQQKCKKSPLRHLRAKSIFSKFKKAFSFFKNENIRIVSVSKWLMERAESSSVLSRFSHSYILNGIDTNVFNYNINQKNRVVNLQMQHYLLFVTAMFRNDTIDNKGGYYIVELAKKMHNAGLPNKIVVLSSYHDIKGDIPNNIVFLGRITNQLDLVEAYRNATLSLIVSQKETFGMTVAESLCCGTPVVGFKCGGPESFADTRFSTFLPYGNINELFETVCEYLNKTFDKQTISKSSIEHLSTAKSFSKYLDLYNDLLKTK